MLPLASCQRLGDHGRGRPDSRGIRHRDQRRLDSVEQTALDLGRRHLDRPIRQERIQCVADVILGRRITGLADLVLIIDGAAVTHPPGPIQNQDLRVSFHQSAVGNLVLGIFEDREVDAHLMDVPRNVLLAVMGIGADPQEHDALRFVVAIHLDQPGGVLVCHRTVGSDKDQHDRPAPAIGIK